ncbi:SCP2 sterol-binding domain-containing protein [Janibacter limosus]|jgi:putative sterol carrier protein|uniref:SCP2 sterol-binding domain-containing protein n=1 Tax=Janibacter limosus TaxID=53458 RepID=A0A4P6MR43_9MICO|nr:SCP2 sterol-binding domain-containing protein [Janibacter limosus]QBF45052.1 SCP2 sterol-binding domain-containing protein [Janibacter limosus]
MDLDPSTFESMTPQEFARTVKAMSDNEIAEVMRGEHRVPILDAIFGRFPELFRADKAGALSAVIQFRITGGPDDHPHDTYEVVIDDGACSISDAPGEQFDASLMMAPPEFTKIATGRGNPTMLVMRGKIKVKGDIAVAAKFPTLFDIPKA